MARFARIDSQIRANRLILANRFRVPELNPFFAKLLWFKWWLSEKKIKLRREGTQATKVSCQGHLELSAKLQWTVMQLDSAIEATTTATAGWRSGSRKARRQREVCASRLCGALERSEGD